MYNLGAFFDIFSIYHFLALVVLNARRSVTFILRMHNYYM